MSFMVKPIWCMIRHCRYRNKEMCFWCWRSLGAYALDSHPVCQKFCGRSLSDWHSVRIQKRNDCSKMKARSESVRNTKPASWDMVRTYTDNRLILVDIPVVSRFYHPFSLRCEKALCAFNAVERSVRIREVKGSNPSVSTTIRKALIFMAFRFFMRWFWLSFLWNFEDYPSWLQVFWTPQKVR